MWGCQIKRTASSNAYWKRYLVPLCVSVCLSSCFCLMYLSLALHLCLSDFVWIVSLSLWPLAPTPAFCPLLLVQVPGVRRRTLRPMVGSLPWFHPPSWARGRSSWLNHSTWAAERQLAHVLAKPLADLSCVLMCRPLAAVASWSKAQQEARSRVWISWEGELPIVRLNMMSKCKATFLL